LLNCIKMVMILDIPTIQIILYTDIKDVTVGHEITNASKAVTGLVPAEG
jgi:hypothetical protein